jgi:hypothetical protein
VPAIDIEMRTAVISFLSVKEYFQKDHFYSTSPLTLVFTLYYYIYRADIIEHCFKNEILWCENDSAMNWSSDKIFSF